MIDRRGEVWEMPSGSLYLLTQHAIIPNGGWPGYGWRVLELSGPTDGSDRRSWLLINESWLSEHMTRLA